VGINKAGDYYPVFELTINVPAFDPQDRGEGFKISHRNDSTIFYCHCSRRRHRGFEGAD
jgi:hypothetical protein